MFGHIWTLTLSTGVQLIVIISFLHCNLQLRSDGKRPAAAKESSKYFKKQLCVNFLNLLRKLIMSSTIY